MTPGMPSWPTTATATGRARPTSCGPRSFSSSGSTSPDQAGASAGLEHGRVSQRDRHVELSPPDTPAALCADELVVVFAEALIAQRGALAEPDMEDTCLADRTGGIALDFDAMV